MLQFKIRAGSIRVKGDDEEDLRLLIKTLNAVSVKYDIIFNTEKLDEIMEKYEGEFIATSLK